MADQSKVNRADAQFAKLRRAEDGKKAMSEYEAERAAVRVKTERLKALRLARDAELGAAAAAAPAKPSATKKAAVKKAPAKKAKTTATLSQWLSDQHGSGRNS